MTEKPWFQDLPMDRAYEEISKMDGVEQMTNGGITIYKGNHPDHGDIRIVIDPFTGAGTILYFPI